MCKSPTRPHTSLLSYDIATALILLLDKDQAVLVDVSLCVNPSSSWVRERLGVLMIIGYIETSSVSPRCEYYRLSCIHCWYDSKVQVPIPTIPAYAPAPVIDPQLLFRALRVIQASDLDLDLWNLAIEERAKADVYTG